MKLTPQWRSFGRYALAGVTVIALVLGVTLLEVRGAVPGEGLWFLLRPKVSDADRLLVQFTRTTVQLMMLFTTVTAIAVPLTANLYTPRLIDLFIRDRINQAFLGLLVSSAAMAHYTLYVMRDSLDLRFAPLVLINLSVGMGFLCILLAVPYVYHMFNFLQPHEIVRRMRVALLQRLDLEQHHDTPALRLATADLVEQIGEVALRASGRNDNGMAARAIDELEKVALVYRDVKPTMPDGWFEGHPQAGLTIPAQAVEHLQESRCWFEFHLFRTLSGLLPASMANTPDVVTRVGRVVRVVACWAEENGDTAVVKLALKFQNTFLRQAISSRQVRGFYHLSNEYRMLGEALLSSDEAWEVSVAESLAYYAGEASTAGVLFARDIALYDLAELVVRAEDGDPPRRGTMLELLVSATRDSGGRLEPVTKVLAHGLRLERTELTGPLTALLAERPQGQVADAVGQVLAAEMEEYREITGRIVDLNYLPPEDRQRLREWWQSARVGATAQQAGAGGRPRPEG